MSFSMSSTVPAMKSSASTYTIREAAERCGYKRPNTFREKFLSSPELRQKLSAGYDHKGRLVLDRVAVNALVKQLERERESRGNWRRRNLGDWAEPGPRPRRTEPESGRDTITV